MLKEAMSVPELWWPSWCNLKSMLLVTVPLRAIRAAKQATKTIPIGMVTTRDPIATGLIDSLARPVEI
jgi:hypothetical protein